ARKRPLRMRGASQNPGYRGLLIAVPPRAAVHLIGVDAVIRARQSTIESPRRSRGPALLAVGVVTSCWYALARNSRKMAPSAESFGGVAMRIKHFVVAAAVVGSLA